LYVAGAIVYAVIAGTIDYSEFTRVHANVTDIATTYAVATSLM